MSKNNNNMEEQNNACAQYNLGLCYENGNGVEKDINKAIECYEEASIENSDAQDKIEYFYKLGIL